MAAAIPVLAASTLVTGCSSYDPAQASAWQRDYCVKLAAWQSARDTMVSSAGGVDASDWQKIEWPEYDRAEEAGSEAIDAAQVLDRENLDHASSHIFDDTEKAVIDRNADAEARAVIYCSGSGFEDLVQGTGN
ncbi:hypothetical protein STRCI_008465 [Streptomyces cinnabarinus]|uniref:Lipoprotein n=1 Tax=Streptomyces cinnabarinus TaxID=67287 RepID=A0ABY7KQH6_9ACTN|nr:hypothetical protein [Streptomyces cinnabarinus]WAZ26818.1 hypothetical protein STRCI_008465 [Streptomyces cinnabarinus]